LDDDEISVSSSNEESSKGDDYKKLLFPETHEISDSDDIATHADKQMGMGGVSRIFL
jgi:hypothetical protein